MESPAQQHTLRTRQMSQTPRRYFRGDIPQSPMGMDFLHLALFSFVFIMKTRVQNTSLAKAKKFQFESTKKNAFF
jgi:hypothetical protein